MTVVVGDYLATFLHDTHFRGPLSHGACTENFFENIPISQLRRGDVMHLYTVGRR
jgi:hypothetical protein